MRQNKPILQPSIFSVKDSDITISPYVYHTSAEVISGYCIANLSVYVSAHACVEPGMWERQSPNLPCKLPKSDQINSLTHDVIIKIN